MKLEVLLFASPWVIKLINNFEHFDNLCVEIFEVDLQSWNCEIMGNVMFHGPLSMLCIRRGIDSVEGGVNGPQNKII